jgi:hypothetical protein
MATVLSIVGWVILALAMLVALFMLGVYNLMHPGVRLGPPLPRWQQERARREREAYQSMSDDDD